MLGWPCPLAATVTGMQSQRFAAGFTPLPTAARVSRQRGALRWRVISSLISLGLLVAFIYFLGRDWPRGWTITIVSLWVASTVFWFAISIVGFRRAKRDLGGIHEGVAFYLDGQGVEVVHPTPARIPWDQVSSFKLGGHNFGAGPQLVIEANGQTVTRVPVSFLDATPAVIDSAAQAYSLGRVRPDTRLDRVW